MDKIKVGILGFGSFAERRLVPGFSRCERAEIVAVTKRDAGKARERAGHFNIPNAYSYDDKQSFFQTPGMEAVFVASANNAHAADAIECLKAGKHVIVEKPMAMNAAECERMIAAAREHGRELMVAQCLRYNKTVGHVKGLVASGQLGSPVTGKCDFHSDGRRSTRTWKYDLNVAGGGAAFDLGVHVVDTMRFITGLAIKQARCSVLPRARGPNGVDDVATFLLDFDGEFIATCESSFRTKRNLLLEIFGEKGYVRAFDWNENLRKVRVETEIDEKFSRYEVENGDMYAAEIDDFCRCIAGEIPNPVPGDEGLVNQRVIDLVNQRQ
ncbi:MAG: Gfo/Idh/MocA family oxidoreductase [Candidatus Lokiarchaeota archaeon]|nr:Gfo/Idh/MocA family oxidoreductase [Candidatus Lokiarchaeota archaeon]